MEPVRAVEHHRVVSLWLAKDQWIEIVKKKHSYFTDEEIVANWEKSKKFVFVEADGERVIKAEYQDVQVTIEILD